MLLKYALLTISFPIVYSDVVNITTKIKELSIRIDWDLLIDIEILPDYMLQDSCPIYYNVSIERIDNSSDRQQKEIFSPGLYYTQ